MTTKLYGLTTRAVTREAAARKRKCESNVSAHCAAVSSPTEQAASVPTSMCPSCRHQLVDGPAGGLVCDECGMIIPRRTNDIRQTPLYGVIGGPFGAC